MFSCTCEGTACGRSIITLGMLANMNGGIDANGPVTITGCTIIATGARISASQSDSTQQSVTVSVDQTQPAGTLIELQNTGEALVIFAPASDFQTLLFSSPDLVGGVVGGTAPGDSIDGLYTEPANDPGTEVGTVNTEKRQSGPVRPGRWWPAESVT